MHAIPENAEQKPQKGSSRATRHALWTLGLAALIFAPNALADAKTANWPQFRGPGSDGISSETGLLESWPKEGPEVLWRVEGGGGFSGLSIVDGTIYTLYSKGGDEMLVALDAANGKTRWSLRTDEDRKDRFGDGPRSTPLVDGELVYAASALGKLYAVEAKTGKKRWSHDLQKTFGAQVPTWGVSASPLVLGNKLLFDVGGKAGYGLMAFDKRTGEVLWHSGGGLPGYSIPIAFEVGGVEQVAFFTGDKILAVSPDDGRELWQRPWKTSYDINAAAPIFIAPDKLYVSSGYDTGAALLRIQVTDGKASVKEAWRSRKMKNQFSSAIYLDGSIYGFDNKNFKCIDAETGEDQWRQGGLGHGSLFYADGHLIVLSDSGELRLVEANPKAYIEKAASKILSGKHWTVPTLYGGTLYVRNESEIVAYKVGA